MGFLNTCPLLVFKKWTGGARPVFNMPAFEGCLRQPYATSGAALLLDCSYVSDLQAVGRCAAHAALRAGHSPMGLIGTHWKGQPLPQKLGSCTAGSDAVPQITLHVLLTFQSRRKWPAPPRHRAVRAADGRIRPSRHLSPPPFQTAARDGVFLTR